MTTLTILKTLILLSSLNMILMCNPVKVSMMLLLASLSMFGTISLQTGQAWFPILFSMLFMGGILMMFMILSSVSPNEKSMKVQMFFMPMIIGVLTLTENKKMFENSEIQKFPKSMLDSSSSFNFIVLLLILYFFSAITMLCKVETPMRNMSCCDKNLIL